MNYRLTNTFIHESVYDVEILRQYIQDSLTTRVGDWVTDIFFLPTSKTVTLEPYTQRRKIGVRGEAKHPHADHGFGLKLFIGVPLEKMRRNEWDEDSVFSLDATLSTDDNTGFPNIKAQQLLRRLLDYGTLPMVLEQTRSQVASTK